MDHRYDARELPVLYVFFDRAEFVPSSFSRIREARPTRLYLACDGPREGVGEDYAEIARYREQVISSVDWNCEVRILFPERNRGRANFIPDAIDWFFKSESFGAIIEDDCVVSKSFFRFLFELLTECSGDRDICGITGSFYLPTGSTSSQSFGSTVFPSTWGWGTWSKVWADYDRSMTRLGPDTSDMKFLDALPESSREPFKLAFASVASGKWNSWAYQLFYLAFLTGRCFLHPHVNLVENVGIQDNSTQRTKVSALAANPLGEVRFPLRFEKTEGYDEWQAANIYAFT